MGFVVFSIVLMLAWWVYGLVPAGSLLTIYIFAATYILVVSAIGLVVSNYSGTIQQAMFLIYFFLIIFILMSGLFTPIRSMPEWAQTITIVNPLKYFMKVMRMIYLKGSTFGDLNGEYLSLCIFALAMGSWAVLSYRKRS
jgi:ABC-2 type transport system permease protein